MAAVWTAPRTWVTGDLVSYSLLNTYVRDNLDWLKSRPVVSAGSISDTSTTSTTYVDMAAMSGSLTVNGDHVLVGFTGWFISDAFRTLTLAIAVDGTTVSAVARSNINTVGNGGTPCHFIVRAGSITPGQRTIGIRWQTSAGEIAANSSSIPRGFYAVEVT